MARCIILLATLVLCQTITVFARPQFDYDNFIFPSEDDTQVEPQTPRATPFTPTWRPTTSGQQETTTTGTTTTDAPQEFTDCVTNCQTTSQYDPVCGTDRVSYNSRARLNCAQRCGLNVQILHIGKC